MTTPQILTPRQLAGRANWLRRRGLTAEGRPALRLAALAHEPWTHATGPKTAAGKTKSAANGRWRQRSVTSMRAIRRQLGDINRIVGDLKELQRRMADSSVEKESQLGGAFGTEGE